MSQPETNCSRCDHMAAMGITILDAKWLDPACHKGCQSLTLKRRITELEAGRDELLAALKNITPWIGTGDNSGSLFAKACAGVWSAIAKAETPA